MTNEQRYKFLCKYHYYCRTAGGGKRLHPFYLFGLTALLLKYIYLLIRPFLRRIESQKGDIIVLGTCRLDVERSSALWDCLEEKKYSIVRWYLDDMDIYKIAFKFCIPCDASVPAAIFFQDLLATYILKRFSDSSLICLFHSHDVFPSLLRMRAESKVKTVFIPHGVISSEYEYSSQDFDYYLVFGESSLKNIFNSSVRIGKTKAIKTGSPQIRSSDFLMPGISSKNLLFLSTWLVGRNLFYNKNLDIVIEWARKNPNYNLLIRLHPLEDGNYILSRISNVRNITILDKQLDLQRALEKASLVITTFSNASIEAALANRPTVIVNYRNLDVNSIDPLVSDQYLYFEHFFSPRSKNAEELDERITDVFQRFDFFVQKCQDFARFHLEHAQHSNAYIASVLENILKGDEAFIFESLEETAQQLNKD